MLRYGMKFEAIRYWQTQALSLYRRQGLYLGRGYFEGSCLNSDARDLAYHVIALAFVASPEHLKAVLTGTRKNRWR